MNKFVLQIFIAVFAFSFAACSGNSKADKSETETTIQADPAVQASFDQYVTLVDKSLSLVEKIKKGDAAARQEWVVNNAKIKSLALELQRASESLTKEQNAKIVELAKSYAETATAIDSL